MSVDQQIKQHLRSRMAMEISDVAPAMISRAVQQAVQLPPVQPPPARSAMRLASNLLVIAGVLILGYVVVNQSYVVWQEQNAPRNQQMAGIPITTYLSGGLLDTPTPTSAVPTAVIVSPQQAKPTAEVADLPQINNTVATAAVVPPVGAQVSRVRRIVAPVIKLDVPVIDVGWKPVLDQKTGQNVAVWEVAEYAAGHHQGSATPGTVGNIVVSGHNDWKGEVFRYLENLELGNEISLYNEEGVEFRYLITQIERVKEADVPLEQRIRNAEYMNPTPDQTLTLITCWPYKIDTYRLIVIAKPYNVVKAAGSKQDDPLAGPTLR